MKILLIYPQYTHSSEFDLRTPSMSLVYLASVLESRGHQVIIYDASLGPIVKEKKVFRYGVSEKEVRNVLSTSEFDLVGITCSFVSRWRFVSRIAQQVKEVSPNTIVAIGGLFPTYSWRYCLENCRAIDFVMLGEAELNFAQVIDNLCREKDINAACKNVEAVAWRMDGQIFCHPQHHYNENLNALPFPAWHLMDLKKYFLLQKKVFDLASPCLPILSSRGCPNGCRFCNMYITHGYRWRGRSAENVLEEIGFLIDRFGVRRFYFVDDNFSQDIFRAKQVLRGIIERRLNIKYNFHNGLSIKNIDYELVRLMKQSGCTSVCLGIESGSERIRNQVYGKRLSEEKIFEVLHWFRKQGIPTIAYFMVGAPGENCADFVRSKELVRRLAVNLITVSIYTPYQGTELYEECRNKGWLRELSPEDTDRVEMFSPMLKTPDFTPEDVIRWQRELYLTFVWHHWFILIKEALRPGGVVNLDALGKFLGLLKFRPKGVLCE